MKVKSLRDFYDLDAKKQRKVGNQFDCSDERGEYLISVGYAEKCADKPVEKVAERPSVSKDDAEKD